MAINHYLLAGLVSALAIILYLALKLYHVREQIAFIKDVIGRFKKRELKQTLF